MGWFGRLLAHLGLGDVIWPLVALGAILIVVGLSVPGTQSQTASVLVLFGCIFVAVGVMTPQFKRIELPGGAKVESENGEDPAPWLEANKPTMTRIARLMLNDDVKRAKNTVRKALATARRYRAQTHPGNRDTTTYRTLVVLLKRAEERGWFDGAEAAMKPCNAIEALQLVDFDERIAYVLSQQMRTKDVAVILEREEQIVKAEIDACRKTIAPYTDSEREAHG